MHLLAAQAGAIQQDGEAIDLGQTPADLLFLSAADSELAMLAAAADRAGTDKLRLASLLRLGHNLSVDLWIEQTARHARLIVARLLGGAAYWPYGVDELTALSLSGIRVAFLPGDANPDPILRDRSTIDPAAWSRLHALFTAGGPDNFDTLLKVGLELASPSSGASRHLLPEGEKNAAASTKGIPVPVGERLGEGDGLPNPLPPLRPLPPIDRPASPFPLSPRGEGGREAAG